MTEIIIGIPGVWKNRTELIQAVASQSDGYQLAGQVLDNQEKGLSFHVEVYEYAPHLKEAFSYASKGAFPDRLLTEIDQHTYTVYIIAEVSDFEAVINLIDAGAALLKAGGLAVKIETAGMAHTKEAWQTLQKNPDIIPVYAHFVTIIGEDDHYGSFGMKAFGLPDVVTPNTMSPKDAVTLLSTFNFYNLGERPTFTNGQDFRIKSDAPTYTLTSRQDFRYEEDHPFYNPYGLWSLEK